jgi:hypothetical protein
MRPSGGKLKPGMASRAFSLAGRRRAAVSCQPDIRHARNICRRHDHEKDSFLNKDINLAPPGSGLPNLERLAASSLLQGMRALLSKERLSRWLRRETERVLTLAASLPEALTSHRVLMPRLTGLEDDSRYWSVNMVLQHLVIVDSGIRELAVALADGQSFVRQVRIAEVKPDAAAGPEQQALLQGAVDDYLGLIDSLGDLRTAGRHAHPWFGELDLRGWHALSAMHATAHRRQMQGIVRQLHQVEIRRS